MAASPVSPGSADVLLFDLGRVVLDTDFERVMARWAADAGCQPADLASRFVVNDNFKHHETGKIDDAAYDHVVKAIGVPASRILFFDDSAANIEGARARGLGAIHVTSTDDVARALTALGI